MWYNGRIGGVLYYFVWILRKWGYYNEKIFVLCTEGSLPSIPDDVRYGVYRYNHVRLDVPERTGEPVLGGAVFRCGNSSTPPHVTGAKSQ